MEERRACALVRKEASRAFSHSALLKPFSFYFYCASDTREGRAVLKGSARVRA